MKTILDVCDLCTSFGPVRAVDRVSFSLRSGEVLGLVGESGSGKSVTGFSVIRLLDQPGHISGGRILFHGRDLASETEEGMRQLRGNRIAMIFQDPMMTLNPVLHIDTQMVEAVRAHQKVGVAEARRQARDALGAVGIPSPEERLAAYPHQFSGGMRQRVAIAIALLHNPDVIIADEPTTALDVTIQAQILSEVQRLVRERNTSLIWITHDLSVVAGLADRVAVMYSGRIVEHGPTDPVLDHALHPYTHGLIGSVPSRNRRGQRLAQIPGTTMSIDRRPPGCPFHTRCARAQDVCRTEPPPVSRGAEHTALCFFPMEEAARLEVVQ
ncbi:ABC transporter ATP-binding protein [Pseudorhizobium pelagicum]|uniref:Methionine ABC transporter ATP-binding protein n=1 Tax=Pseudorhizobium pelagicum TaxID=1509405 RepID=A0A922NZR7_9HYPH|nr:ABC transporter ATP-binding protein [Pseudorhizobium pelagicum]KEQ03677.1 methionine ABC transporter ATP-binding protein [Pseudorhizobium pelagicum]KEQ08266.1 methionine ABC transporter ATP-binding protein [Pseudorhizobium pelagicum]